MTQGDLMKSIGSECGVSVRTVRTVLKSFKQLVKEELELGGQLTMPGFVQFTLRYVKEQDHISVTTGQNHTIPAHYTPFCRFPLPWKRKFVKISQKQLRENKHTPRTLKRSDSRQFDKSVI